MTAIYQHPDGHSIDFTDNILTVVSCDGTSVSVPIGPDGLASLWCTRAAYTTKDLAEQDGNELATECLAEILNAPNQAAAVTALTNALLELHDLPHPKRAAGGFAGVFVPYIEAATKAALS